MDTAFTGIQTAACAVDAPIGAHYYRDLAEKLSSATKDEAAGGEFDYARILEIEIGKAKEFGINRNALRLAKMLQKVFSVDWSQVKTDRYGSDGHWKTDIHEQIDAIRVNAESHTLEEMARALDQRETDDIVGITQAITQSVLGGEDVERHGEVSDLSDSMSKLSHIYIRLTQG